MQISPETLSQTTPISADKPFIRQLATHPDIIIRTDRAIAKEEDTPTETDIRKMIHEQKDAFANIKHHGIAIPSFYSLPASPESKDGRWNMVTVSQRVVGVNMDHIQELPSSELSHASQEMEATFIHLTSYYQAQLAANKPALTDIFGTEQWMFGHTKKDTTDKIYLVDTDTFVMQFTKDAALKALLLFMNTLEMNFDRNFLQAREKLLELL